MFIVQTLILLLLLTIIVVFNILGDKDNRFFNIKTGICLVFFIYFCLVPFLLLTVDVSNLSNIHIIRNLDFSREDFVNPIWKFLLFFLVFIFFYKIFHKRGKYVFIEKNYFFIKTFAMFFFVVGFFSLLKYTVVVGGVTTAISDAEYLRSPYAPDLGLTVVKLMQPLIVLSSYLYFMSMFAYPKNILLKIMFLSSSILSLYYFIIFAGRLPLFIYLLSFIIFYLSNPNKRKKIDIKKFFLFSAVITILMFIVLFYDSFYQSSANTTNASIEQKILKLIVELSFPYVNNINVESHIQNLGSYRFFLDYFLWLIRIIPSDILSYLGVFKPISLDQVNTILHGTTMIGGIPVDIISLGYYQLSYIGIIFNGMFLALFASYIENISSSSSNPIMRMFKIKMLLYIPFILVYADPDTFIIRRLDSVLLIIIIRFFLIRSK